ncbi:hypothetical protein CTEN210_01947 [Chaetoceros tenuissimus]|uniref:5'-3' DNA helicase ZGRF1-like N-terminal domain-containing protein n=1 Tax=Chaetoceros tenuissimus TaxID=426638 RepID=A0AAD3CGL7_9STRA|nr:hypothetical protein CTEN210_01947 [Chaetoceros tenuissimus]
MASKCFSCLYTKHKTQKRKKWADGRVIVQKSGLVHLYANDPTVVGAGANMILDTVALSIEQAKLIIHGTVKEIDFEKYICEIEGEWNAPNASNGSGSQGASVTSSIDYMQKDVDNRNLMARKRKSDSGMQKLLNSKFRKPTKFIPTSKRPSQNMVQVQRKRPLQPGEYMRQFQNGGNHINSGQNLNGDYGQNANLQPHMRPVSQRGQPSLGLNEVHSQQNFQQRPSSHSNSNPYQKSNPEAFQQHSFSSTGNNSISSTTGFQQPKPQHANQNQSKTNNFVSNDFDPSSFYEESDNESNDDCQQDLHARNSWETSNNSNHLHTINQNVSVGNSKEHSRYGQQQQAPLSRNRSENNQNESLSTNEDDENHDTMTNDDLLQLFNVGDVDDSTNQSEVKDIEHGRNINEKQKDKEQTQNCVDSHPNFSNNPFLKNLLRSDEKLDDNTISLGNAVSVECEIGNTTQPFSGEEDDDESRCENIAHHCKDTNAQSDDDDAPISFDINCNDLSSEESSDDNE